jgi:V/A-type H+-transporting ATPase subunit F
VGSRVFVTSSQLAGIEGIIVKNPEKALEEIKKLTNDSNVGLVLVSDDISDPINDQLTELRTEKSTLVFTLPAPGSKKSEVDYRVMLKKILGV